MPELRWILLAAGVVLLAGLWWWESRRKTRGSAHDTGTSPETAGRNAPRMSGGDEPAAESPQELPPIRASRRERGGSLANPPVVEIPEDAEPELARRGRTEEPPVRVPYRSMQDQLDDIPEDLQNLPASPEAEAEQRQPWVRTQPLDREKVMNGGPGETSTADATEPAAETGETTVETRQPERQKIVALRLVAPGKRWAGVDVVAALEAEGLTFGKYSIFHRARDDGKSIFYVASLVEPGSFDLDNIDSTSVPGVSIFGVVPGPVDAATTFDTLLATARRLADRLAGQLQDEQGSTLTAQRILNLREELVHFEHVTKRIRAR